MSSSLWSRPARRGQPQRLTLQGQLRLPAALLVVGLLCCRVLMADEAHDVDNAVAHDATTAPGVATTKLYGDHGTRFDCVAEFNGNALAEGVRTDTIALARTVSGHLLAFDSKTFAFRKTLSLPSPAVVLSRVGERILAGCENGQIFEFELEGMRCRAITKLGGAPQWIGPLPRVLRKAESEDPQLDFVAFTQHTFVDRNGDRVEEYAVSLPGSSHLSRKSIRVTAVASYLGITPILRAFHLTPEGVLWVGMDRGEWGGAVAFVDLPSGKQGDFELPGVYGITRVKDRLFAYGGITHTGYRQSFVVELQAPGEESDETPEPSDGFDDPSPKKGGPKAVCQFSNGRERRPRAHPFANPEYPITHIFPLDDAAGSCVLVGYGECFRTSDFKSFEFLGEADGIRFCWDHPHAEGASPALRSITLDRVALDKDSTSTSTGTIELCGVTARDGWFQWRPGSPARLFALSNQLEGTPFHRVRVDNRVLFDSYEDGPWPDEKVNGGWVTRELIPPALKGEATEWRQHKIFVGDAESLWVLLRGPKSPGAVCIAQWKSGTGSGEADTVEVLYHKTALSSIDLESTLRCGDGRFWTYDRGLRYFDGKSWIEAPGKNEAYRVARVLGPFGSQWLCLDTRSEGLFAFPQDPQEAGFHLHHMVLKDAVGYANDVVEALPMGSGYLLATDEGLMLLRNPGQLPVAAPFPAPSKMQRMGRSGNGDLWFVAKGGLWRSAKESDRCEQVLGFFESWDQDVIFDISADPKDDSSVWLALGNRGVMRVRAVSP